jgi:alpha-glucosidase (family GH31 glycosyl hydrolase)
MGLAGLPYFGSDIGGYMSQGTVSTTEELFYRWTTLGALSPVMRTHHGRNVTTNVQWEYNAGTVAHFAKWSRLHMQLAAYFAGSLGSYDRDGLPLFRFIPLSFPDPTNDWAWSSIDEYLLGDRILVAPILQEGATSRDVIFPNSYPWYPLLGGGFVDHGVGTAITVTAAKEDIPVFVPMGSIIVLYPPFDTVLPAPASSATTLADVSNAREVWVYRGKALDPVHAQWNDQTGPVGTPNWIWQGDEGAVFAALPATATFNGAPVTVTTDGVTATVTVTGNGQLVFGGSLTIARDTPGVTKVVLH